MLGEIPAVQETDLGEENCRHEGHLRQLLQASLHLELVPLLFAHEGHGANIPPKHPHTSLHFTVQH